VDLQTLVVAAIVAACASYSTWTLMPAAARRKVATTLLKLPLPTFMSVRVAKHATTSSACACDGCDKGKAPIAASTPAGPSLSGGVAPLVFHPRLRK
jgi:hypothetical protein